jgi:hypothetical protein
MNFHRVIGALAMPSILRPRERFVGRQRTRDVAFQFRMATGFAGEIARHGPFSVVSRMADPTNPPLNYGVPVILMTSGAVRQFISSDTGVTDPFGIIVRPYPMSPQTATGYGAAGIGATTPPTNFPVDILVSGFVTVAVNGTITNIGAPTSVFVWCAASTGAHIAGGFEAASSGGNTATLNWDKTFWNSPAGPDGIAELGFNV